MILPMTSREVADLTPQPPRIATDQQSASFGILLANETERQATVQSQAPAVSSSNVGAGSAASAPTGGSCTCGMSSARPDPSTATDAGIDGPVPTITVAMASSMTRVGPSAAVEPPASTREQTSPSDHRCADTLSGTPARGTIEAQSHLQAMNLNAELLRQQTDRSILPAAVAGARIEALRFGATGNKFGD